MKILEMSARLIDNGKNISGDVIFEGDRGNVVKGASLCVAELIRMISKETGNDLMDIYARFNKHLMEDLFEGKR